VKRLSKCVEGRHELRDRALIWFCVGAGLRVGEAVRLRLRDFAGDTLIVEKSSAKSKKSRRVYLSPAAQEHVQAYLAERGPGAPDDALLVSQKGSHLNANYGVRLLERLFELAGIEGATSHSLRRTHANTLRKNKADMLVIQTQLGHSSLAVTQRYLHASPEEHRAALAGLTF
jgi:integrase